MVVSFCAVSFPGLQVKTLTPLIVACWVTSLLPITSTFVPAVRLAADTAAPRYVVPLVTGGVATLGVRLWAGSPDRLKGVCGELDPIAARAGPMIPLPPPPRTAQRRSTPPP